MYVTSAVFFFFHLVRVPSASGSFSLAEKMMVALLRFYWFWVVSLLNVWRCAGFVACGDGDSQLCKFCVFCQVVEACSGGTAGSNMQGYNCCNGEDSGTVLPWWCMCELMEVLVAHSGRKTCCR
ncbi:hypothetical protein DEO72_LG1g2518 [Vigna unguiculata]|uniref:Secreted protein n=1 Tax=Vigna unguiculata TaxID=3917 RepID=A0A4D6KMX2_VIGUN|nr:hypothetical protein DEO72_LG1g2518 [Vigna unguiculata]